MKNLKNGKIIIETRKRDKITMDELFKRKKQFHTAASGLPFEEKIKILMKMWDIVKLRH